MSQSQSPLCGQRGKISQDFSWQTSRLFGTFCHCCWPLTFITSLWIASRNSNRTFPDICKRCESACPTDFLSFRVYLWHETTRSMGLAY